jgi:SARP family transcriptional regulator, regulator of embCAB operon
MATKIRCFNLTGASRDGLKRRQHAEHRADGRQCAHRGGNQQDSKAVPFGQAGHSVREGSIDMAIAPGGAGNERLGAPAQRALSQLYPLTCMVHSAVGAGSAEDAVASRRQTGRVKPVDVVIVDDHPVFAQALAMAIDSSGDLRCAGVASTAEGALSLTEQAQPDAVVMDIGLGDDDGIALTREITSRYPETRVLILTGQNPSPAIVQASAEARASGFLPKMVSLGTVVDAVPLLSTECFVTDRELIGTLCAQRAARSGAAATRSDTLTHRERDILELLVEGVDVQAAALRLGITVNTARGYVKNLYRKLGVHNQLELLAVARRRELL